MRDRIGAATAVTGLLWIFVVAPSTARAQPLDPSVVAGTSGLVRGVASIAVVGLVGAGVLFQFRGFVDRAVDDTMDRPVVAVVYGLLAYVLVLFATLYAGDIMTRLALTGTALGTLVFVVLVVALLAVSAAGYLVVGTIVTDVLADRRPWQGLALGAAISAVAWIALPTVPAVVAWILVPAVGVGGPMRKWVHRDRTVETEPSG